MPPVSGPGVSPVVRSQRSVVLHCNFQFIEKFAVKNFRYLPLKRHLHRKATRFNLCRPFRNLDRSCLRGRRRGPDDLSQAFTAFGRAIRAHRRLARLAPEFFDSALVEREASNRAEQRRWMALWKPLLDKVYGYEPEPPDSDVGLPALPPVATQHAVDLLLVEHHFCMEAGRLAMERHQQRYPHALCNWSRLARLLHLALGFKQLTCGLDSKHPLPERISYANDIAALERAHPQP